MQFDELIRAITELIDTWNKQSVPDAGMSIGNWIAIIVSIVSLSGVVFSTIITTRTTKRVSKKNIDAHITANARIEWIQNVRKATAELLSVYYSVLIENDIEKKQDSLQRSREKKELLILFFGPDKDKNSESKKIAVTSDLFDTTTNKGKNDFIVEYLNELSKMMDWHVDCTSRNEFKILQERYSMFLEKAPDHVISYKEIPVETDEGIQYSTEFEYDDIFAENIHSAENQVNAYMGKLKDISKALQDLSEIIRIYGKLEWERAKEGI